MATHQIDQMRHLIVGSRPVSILGLQHAFRESTRPFGRVHADQNPLHGNPELFKRLLGLIGVAQRLLVVGRRDGKRKGS
jgi:hypothetical protein